MPYTLAHPLFAAPLRRLGLPLSALAAGAMAPDLPLWATAVGFPRDAGVAGYFITHSPAGILTADVLTGLAIWVLWVGLLRVPLIDALPLPIRRRIPSAPELLQPPPGHLPALRTVALAWVAVVLGALTHVVLDAFTHAGRWGARSIPWLDQSSAGLPLTSWLQYGTSLIGVAGVALAYLWMVARTAPQPLPVRSPAARRVVQVLILIGVLVAIVDASYVAAASLHGAAFIVATRGVLTVVAGWAIGSAVWMLIGPWVNSPARPARRHLVE